ncbi:phosphoprotein phosphatase [Bacteriovorax sp. BSW11_IV]|uniref:PP2C family protein-serine/threonine phosphatase n=1 Tax=Bacteriovorax sp. BSW11_IV TaxID=1353529 RepID=UPI00038A2FE9|nr:protein phosphatase 2C domain-containing protein [Bacteriovorax sp. BSW11_IV]EQC46293.1 phosphoprotein phosphatase [Bacteriovorax sp. BSW11_IV]
MIKSYSAKTNQGPCLEVNEDDIHIDIANKLFLAFDGFGGAGIGDKTVGDLKNKISDFYTKIGGDPDSTMPFFYDPKNLIETNAFINSMLMAHEDLLKKNEPKQMHQRGGASMMATILCENILSVVSVGNLVCALVRDSKVQLVTTPDTMDPPWIDTYQPHFYTTPLNAFGLFTNLNYESKEIRVRDGDTVLVMSDGVYSRLTPKDIREIVANGQLKEVEKVDKLFALSNERGNRDNQSAIILRF